MRNHTHPGAVGSTDDSPRVVVLQTARSRVSDAPYVNKNNRLSSDASGIWSISQSGLPLMLMGDKPLSTDSNGGMGFRPYKRAIDMFASVLLIVLFAPLMLLVAAAIKLTSQGPVLVKEEREGLLSSRFQMLKFRTTETERPHGHNVQRMKPRDVARATSFGKFLRSTELDRLPQLFNILRGDMSLVGPRPHMPGMRLGTGSCEDSIPNYHLRHQVRPGLLGWAQANGYRDQPTSSRALTEAVNHDIAYAQNASLILDLKIIVRSIATELVGSARS